MTDVALMVDIYSISVDRRTKVALKEVLSFGHSGRMLGARLREVDSDLYATISKLGSVGETYYCLTYGEPSGCTECGGPTKFKSVVDGYNPFCSRKCAALQARGTRKSVQYAHPKALSKVRTNIKLGALVYGAAPAIRGRIKQKAPKSFLYIEDTAKRLGVPFAQVLYHVTSGSPVPNCAVCGEHTRFYSAAIGYKEYCSANCAQKCPDVREVAARSFANRDQIKASAKSLKKYGTLHHTQSVQVKDARKKTCMDKYGVGHPLQHPDIAKKVFEKAVNHTKTEVDGCTFWLSGYERHALSRLLLLVDADRIITIGREGYRTFRYADGRVYYPDFIVGKTVIEVKSTYTCSKNKETWENICNKAAGVRASGFKYVLWVFNKSGTLAAKPTTDLSFKKMKAVVNRRP